MKLKKIMALGMAMVTAFSLIACGGSNSGKPKNAESGQKASDGAATQEVIELKLPTFLAGENVGAVFFLPQIERFNKKYEGKYKITVEEVVQDSYAEKIKHLAAQN